eukprot:XP_001705047.1 Hypothetical protein GL50803_39524 [Giardia lamblia ATCC 50803]
MGYVWMTLDARYVKRCPAMVVDCIQVEVGLSFKETRQHFEVIACSASMHYRPTVNRWVSHVKIKALFEEIVQCIYVAIGDCYVNRRNLEAVLLERKDCFCKNPLHTSQIPLICVRCEQLGK